MAAGGQLAACSTAGTCTHANGHQLALLPYSPQHCPNPNTPRNRPRGGAGRHHGAVRGAGAGAARRRGAGGGRGWHGQDAAGGGAAAQVGAGWGGHMRCLPAGEARSICAVWPQRSWTLGAGWSAPGPPGSTPSTLSTSPHLALSFRTPRHTRPAAPQRAGRRVRRLQPVCGAGAARAQGTGALPLAPRAARDVPPRPPAGRRLLPARHRRRRGEPRWSARPGGRTAGAAAPRSLTLPASGCASPSTLNTFHLQVATELALRLREGVPDYAAWRHLLADALELPLSGARACWPLAGGRYTAPVAVLYC